MIVVDIGCETHAGKGRLAGAEESIYKLIRRFEPDYLLGFDPLLPGSSSSRRRRTRITLEPWAAWLYNGRVQMHSRGDGSGITHDGATSVPCFDLPAWLEVALRGPHEVVLKLDCEGAEYPLLHAICNRGIDKALSLVLVEWHENLDREGDFPSYGWHLMGRPELACPVEEW